MVNNKGTSNLQLLVIVIAMFVGIMIIIIEVMPYSEVYNEACRKEGFEKATDLRMNHCGDGFYSAGIECDKKDVFYFEAKSVCIENNKWGDCIKRETKLSETNVSC